MSRQAWSLIAVLVSLAVGATAFAVVVWVPAGMRAALSECGQAIGGLATLFALVAMIATLRLQQSQLRLQGVVSRIQTRVLHRQLRAQQQHLSLESEIWIELLLRGNRGELQLTALVLGRGMAELTDIRCSGLATTGGVDAVSELFTRAVEQVTGRAGSAVRVSSQPIPARLPTGEHVLIRLSDLQDDERDRILAALNGSALWIEYVGLKCRRRGGARIDFSSCRVFSA